jgi:hypothetical protein
LIFCKKTLLTRTRNWVCYMLEVLEEYMTWNNS